MEGDLELASYSHSASPFDIERIILSHPWLYGGLLAIVAASLQVVGLTLQKKAQYKLMGDNLSPEDPKPSWRRVVSKPLWWGGTFLYLFYSPVNMLAMKYAPETTVLPLSSSLIILNAFLSFGTLYERFTKRDITASVVCVLGATVMNTAMSQTISGHLEDFPVDQVVELSEDIFNNPGFAAYIMTWLVLFSLCFYVISVVPAQNLAKPFAVPVMVGLLRALYHFMSKIMMTLVSRRSHPEVMENPITRQVIALTTGLFLLNTYAMFEGTQQLSLRFFVPAMFTACQVLIVTQDLFFFRAWELMSNMDIVVFTAAAVITVVGVAYISPEQRVVSSPDASGLNTPLLSPRTDALRIHHNVLTIMDEYRIRKPTATNGAPLKVIDVNAPIGNFWRKFPIFICSAFVAIPTALWFAGAAFYSFAFLTIFSIYQGWKMGAHIGLFCFLGTKKMAHFENADFQAVYDAEMKDPMWKRRGGPRWKDIYHFVCLPNYKEDTEVLRLAIKSIAASGVAKKQICLVLAMEAREENVQEKAEGLMAEFKDSFWLCQATYHPAGLPGETPGKSANTRWAANQLFDEVFPKYQVSLDTAIITVADADSEFHAEYFAALTYYFIHAGGESGVTPDRYLTIWQPPILHLKNYIKQPSVVRVASFVTSEHELANLSDPNAMRVPYSTYSISASLAKAVQGWDPDWISEDWHMALKCFFSTGGRLRISPIFFPILNYAPEAESWFTTVQARWIQAKRHALGFSEIVYMHHHFPRVFAQIEGRRAKMVYCWRFFFLWVKLLMIHVFMAVFIVFAPLNGVLIGYFAANQESAALSINSWTFLVNCVFQGVGIVAFIGLFVGSVGIYESTKHRIDGAASAGPFWQSRFLHFVRVVPQSILFFPMFFLFGGLAEWIAAVKTARTHKFDYAVALKPKIEKQDEPGVTA
mmetsp:Transcript_25077/g.54569  ORF Transcript_25077/g.54569 Transcript_25077/m.54569 type:complete len:927 (-) Transcript_25077:93-2873(-)|eukprot:CAMPEP_0206452846 /NCGR_PEP_ID=MMETSP0324_2-20121206/20189_1 /ASSEMBLY_ACC=CAM_ASM_000836 /TAXON_ID=2866 /ORGANISM="Crypthecodinium cohnii, Strain Seligo" /LENGTH=926 /DNA_ID=CAMNT_0053923015 /DNA_START=234 /DNA_END=3014 /DNA_ORIENTATION=+